MCGKTTARDVFQWSCLSWDKLAGITIDGALSMKGSKKKYKIDLFNIIKHRVIQQNEVVTPFVLLTSRE